MTSTESTEPRPLAVPTGAVVRIQKIGGDYYAEPDAVPRDDVVSLAAPIVATELRELANEVAGLDNVTAADVLRRCAGELDAAVYG